MKSLFFVFFVIIAVGATSVDIEDMFLEVSNTDFGKTMIANIALELESGASVDTLTTSMRGVRDDLRAQLADGEEHHEFNADQCRDDLAEYNSGHSQAAATMDQMTGSMSLDQSTLDSRTAELAARTTELSEREAMRDSLQASRDAETARFTALVAEHRQVQNLLADVREIVVTRLQNADSFLQLREGTETNMFMTVSSKIKTFNPKKKGFAHGYSAIFNMLAQMLEKNQQQHGDQHVVGQIISVLDTLDDNVAMSMATEKAAERQREEDHEELMERIGAAILYCTNSMYSLSTQLQTLTSKVNAAQMRYDTAEEDLESWGQRISDRQTECTVSANVWENYYNNITAELSTIAKVLYLLEDNRERLGRYGL